MNVWNDKSLQGQPRFTGMGWLQWRWNGVRRAARYALHTPSHWPRLFRNPAKNAQRILQRHGLEVLREAAHPRAFVAYGTLLGLVREGSLLAHDDDIDFGVLEEDWEEIITSPFPGFRRIQHVDWELSLEHEKTGLIVDFFRFDKTPEGRMSRAYSDQGIHEYYFPEKLLKPLGKLGDCSAPANPEGFLAHHYGDWQTPQKNWDYRFDAASETAKDQRD